MTVIRCMIPEIWKSMDRIFYHFGLFFAFLSPQQPEKSKFQKIKKTAEDMTIFHSSTINDNHVIYVS